MSKKVLAALLAAVIGLTIAALCYFFYPAATDEAPAFSGPPETARVAAYAGDVSALVFLAQDEGLFEQNGIDVTLTEFPSGSKSFAAFMEGDADVATIPEMNFISAIQNTDDIRIFAKIALFDVRAIVARRDRGIETPSDLMGKKIGLAGDMSYYYLGVFLPLNGMSYGDVQALKVPSGELNEKLLSGEFDAALQWEPHVSRLRDTLGANATVFSLPENLAPAASFVLAARKSWLDEHPEAAQRLLKGIMAAESAVKADLDGAWQKIAARFGLDNAYVNSVKNRVWFEVRLSQRLVLAMEDEAEWGMENGILTFETLPNFLDYIDAAPLIAVNPDAVTILH